MPRFNLFLDLRRQEERELRGDVPFQFLLNALAEVGLAGCHWRKLEMAAGLCPRLASLEDAAILEPPSHLPTGLARRLINGLC